MSVARWELAREALRSQDEGTALKFFQQMCAASGERAYLPPGMSAVQMLTFVTENISLVRFLADDYFQTGGVEGLDEAIAKVESFMIHEETSLKELEEGKRNLLQPRAQVSTDDQSQDESEKYAAVDDDHPLHGIFTPVYLKKTYPSSEGHVPYANLYEILSCEVSEDAAELIRHELNRMATGIAIAMEGKFPSV